MKKSKVRRVMINPATFVDRMTFASISAFVKTKRWKSMLAGLFPLERIKSVKVLRKSLSIEVVAVKA